MKRHESSSPVAPGRYARTLSAFVERVARNPLITLGICGILTLAALIYSAQTLRINSDDSILTSQEEPFRLDFKAFTAAFPQFDETTLIVLSSDSFDLADDAVDRLSAELLRRDDLIKTLYAPGADDFTKDHLFLYLDLEDLEEVVVRLAEAQPALAALAVDPSLRGLFSEFETSLGALGDGGELPAGFARMANRVSDVTEGLLAGKPQKIAWTDEILAQDEEVYRVIIVQGVTYFDDTNANDRLISGIRAIARELDITPEFGVRMRLTGQVPLAYDELATLQEGLALAASVSLLLLTIILGFGVRSLRIVVSTFVTLAVSLIWSTAYAMATVGEFNLISAAFGVLLIGLGVDFALHIGLRYEEETTRGVPVREALRRATEGAGGPVSLCAVTSAIGFLSFVPTRYYGLGALGIIAGGGMFISLAASFTVFPALLALMRAPTPKNRASLGIEGRLYPLLAQRPVPILVLAALLGAAAIAIASQSTFAFSTLSMRDPNSESVLTLGDLQAKDIVTDYSAIAIAANREEGEKLAAEIDALALVSEVRPPSYFTPDDQDAKLEMLDEAAFFLEPFIHPPPPKPAPTTAERLVSLATLREEIARLPPGGDPEDPARLAIRRLGASLDRLAARANLGTAIDELDALVVSDIEERMAWLRRTLSVGHVTFEDLPPDLRRRLVAPDGRVQVTALPKEDLRELSALIRFVDSVARVAPHATGRPAVEAGIGDIVVSAFREAIGISLIAISAVLLIALRNPLDALMVLTPIALAAFVTVAFGVLIEMPFNMTNVVVIPLVLGLGVDNGIHVFMRVRGDESLAAAMSSSTPRAVLLSALTTLAAFGSLALSSHPGIHSIGVLLSVSVVSLIVCALVVLPAMIQQQRENARRKRGEKKV